MRRRLCAVENAQEIMRSRVSAGEHKNSGMGHLSVCTYHVSDTEGAIHGTWADSLVPYTAAFLDVAMGWHDPQTGV